MSENIILCDALCIDLTSLASGAETKLVTSNYTEAKYRLVEVSTTARPTSYSGISSCL